MRAPWPAGEEVSLHHFQAFHEAAANLHRCIGDISNAKRLHSSLDYRPPIKFEALRAATNES